MNLRKGKALVLAIATIVMVAACGQKTEPLPEVNSENCKPENVQKITDKAQQQEFASACLHRDSFKASPVRNW